MTIKTEEKKKEIFKNLPTKWSDENITFNTEVKGKC